jgi:hypothetical protein
MRKLLLSFLAIAIAFSIYAQDFAPKSLKKEIPTTKDLIHQNGVQGTIFWEEDFDGAEWSGTSDSGVAVPENAPTGWSIVDNTANNFNWRWDTVGPRGIFSSGGEDCSIPSEPLKSYSASNGFLMLESDHFNSNANCVDFTEIDMDAYVQFDAGINMSAVDAVYITFTEKNRFCCMNNETYSAFVEISVDGGTTWTSFSVIEEMSVGSGNPNYMEINISEVAAGQNDVKFRFHQVGLSHYYWLIDDIKFVEPHDYDIAMIDYWNNYLEYSEPTHTNDFQEDFYAYPWFLVSGFKGFHTAVYNYGINDLSNVNYEVTIIKDDVIQETYTAVHEANIASGTYDTLHMQQAWAPYLKGNYILEHNLTHPNESFIYNNFLRKEFKITDTILSPINFEETNSSVGPSDYVNYENSNGLGFECTLPDPGCLGDKNSYYILKGVNIKPAAPENATELALFESQDASAIAAVYRYDAPDEIYIEQISSYLVNINLSDTNQVVYIPFAANGISEYLLDGGKYLICIFMFGTYTDEHDLERTWKLASVEGNKYSSESTVIAAGYGSQVTTYAIYKGAAIALDIQNVDLYGSKGFSSMFQIKDTQENPIEGATIDIAEETLVTNAEGLAEFYTENPNYYQYNIMAENFNTSSGTLDLCDGGEIINITLNGVGIEELHQNLTVYPNPSSGKFSISDIKTGEVLIKNAAGKIVYSGEISNNQFDISPQPAGLYFIEVRNNSEVYLGKVIKK